MKIRETLYRFLGAAIVSTLEIVRVPLFLYRRRKQIQQNEFLYLYYNHSFGHTVIQLDFLSRLYFPHRISVLWVVHPSTNPYMFDCFSQSIDVIPLPQILGKWSVAFTGTSERIMRFYVHLIAGWSKRLHVIDRLTVYNTLSLAHNSLRFGNEESDKIELSHDHTGYCRLVESGIGQAPVLPKLLLTRCQDAIRSHSSNFFDKPFVTLLLREKGVGKGMITKFRSAGPHQNYRNAVSWLTQNGYHVVGTGETRHEVFRDIPGYFSLENIDLPLSLLNVYLLSECRLFIGQMSGGYMLPSSRNILCLITDALSHRLATFRRDNILLFKHLRQRDTGKFLSLVDIYRDHRDLALGYHFKKKNIDIVPNTPEEILSAVQECIAIIEGKFTPTEEEKELIELFHQFPFEGMHLKFLRNRTTLQTLRDLRQQGLL